MTTKQFPDALSEIDDKYILEALLYHVKEIGLSEQEEGENEANCSTPPTSTQDAPKK